MEPIIIKVQVEVGVNKDLQGFITAVLENLYGAQPKAAVAAQEVAKPEAEAPATAETKTEAAPVQPVEEQPAKEYSEVDVRAAMDAARKRIEGEDYKEKPESEGYKKWHKKLNAHFKKIAAELGADKPSALPDSESRGKFIARCAATMVNDNDELIEDLPF